MSIKSFFREIKERREYVHGDKRKLQPLHEKLEQYTPEKGIGKVGRIAGLATVDLVWFLFCVGKYSLKDLNTIFLDNRIIDKLKEKKENAKIKSDDSGFKKFFKKLQKAHPGVAARLHLWMIYTLFTGMVVGGVKVAKHDGNIKEILKELIKKPENKKTSQQHKNYDLSDTEFMSKVVDENWDEIVIGLLEFETYRAVPKLQGTETRQTYGPGITWVYENGKQNACLGEYATKAATFSDEQIWDQVRQHCKYPGECLSVIKNNMSKKGFTELTDNQILGLLFAGYQTPARIADKTIKDKDGNIKETIPGIASRLKAADNNQQKTVDAFQAGPAVAEKYRTGTDKRRWWCAMYYIGKISANDFLSMDRDAFSKININTIMKNGHFVIDDTVIEYALNLKHAINGTVQEFINEHPALHGIGDNIDKTKQFSYHTNDDPSMQETLKGLKAYETKDYKSAIKHYEKAIKLDVDNLEAYSSLSLVYIRFADTTHDISDYEKSLEIFEKLNKRLDENKNLIKDTEIMAAANFNAGLACESIAKLQSEQGDKKSAIKNYEQAKTYYQKAKNLNAKSVYTNAIRKVDEIIKPLQNKTMAFSSGIKKIQEKQNQKNISIIKDHNYSA